MTLDLIAKTIKALNKNIVLIYAFNSTGKTRLSTYYKNVTKNEDGSHVGVYYNAFSEDLFTWDNDIENDEANIQLTIKKSSLNKLHASFTEEEVMRKLEQYRPKYNFFFEYYKDSQEGIRAVTFHPEGEAEQKIKISRGEERIFVWCLFLVMFEVEGWADEQDAHFFIDDPVSSLDDQNIFITATTLYNLIQKNYKNRKIVITTHHIGLYSILSNWLTKGEKADRYLSKTSLFMLNDREGVVSLDPIKNSVFLYHLHLLQTLERSVLENDLVTFHFALLRQVLENIASFLGVGQFSYVLKQIGVIDDTKVSNILNILSHEKVYRYQTEKMTADNESLFKEIFEKLKEKYQFVLR